jgi:uncharacterized repeat protein (TIGR01451 family)
MNKKNKVSRPFNKVILASIVGFVLSGSNAWADVSGTVYRDLPVNGTSLNTYGVKDANELGVEGITVTVTDSSGAVVGTPITTDANGNWTVAGTSGDLRVEFSNIPSYLESSPVNTGSNTTIQFIADGGTADLGLHRPEDYSSSADPLIGIPRFEANVAVGSTALALGSVNYSSTGLNSDYTHEVGAPAPGPVPNVDAEAGEIGSVWGTAWQSDQQRLFAGTFLKRHVGLADGPGYVYVLDYSTSPTTVAHKFDLNGVTPANGGAAIDLGSVCRRSATDGDPDANCDPATTGVASDYELPTSSSAPSVDIDAYAKVGVIGFGDLDMQENTSVLWMINPYQKALISVDVSGQSASLPGAINQYPLASMSNWPTCTTGELRPWALNFNTGRGYLGVICDASISQDRADLHAYVLSFDPDDLAAGFNSELDFSLGYGRYVFAYDRIDFNVWTSTYPPAGMASLSAERMYPQPLFADIEFDKHNNMYLNFLDRWGHQVGGYNYEPLSGNTTLIKTAGGGDIIKVCNVSGSWELEGETNCPVAWVTNISGVTGSGEYFEDEAGDATLESTEGSFAILKGSGQIVSNAMDPHPSGTTGQDYWNTQGITTWDLETGGIDNWYSIEYGSGLGGPNWGKAHGIGDIEILTAPAPLEIGNRVWEDTNGNGVQDAGEAGIDGIDVTLNCGGSDFTQTTANGGQYLFTDANVTGGIPTDTDCTITVPTDHNGQTLTTQNTATDEPLGSNPDTNTGSFTFRTGLSGQNNHTYDIGYRNAPSCTINQPTVSTQCDDNGTDADPSDDRFSYTISATGTGVGLTYDISGGDTQTGLDYNTTHSNLGDFAISGGDVLLTLTDVSGNCSLGSVTATAPATCSSGSTATCTTIMNTATITAVTETDTDSSNDSDSVSIQANCDVTLPDLRLVKRADKTQVIAGETLVFTLELTNEGAGDATAIQVEDNLPAGLTYVSNNPQQGTYDAGTGIWNVGDLAAGQTVTLEITVTID